VLGIVLFSLGSCTQFFTTSLATWAQRDPADLVPEVTASNVDTIVEQADKSPDLSKSVLKKIEETLKDNPPKSTEDKVKLQTAALDAAANASGLVPALLDNSEDIVNAIDSENPEDTVIPLVSEIIAGLDNLSDVSTSLIAIIPDPDTDAFNAFVAEASPEDLAMAAIILLTAEAQTAGGVQEYIENFDPESSSLSGDEALAVALATQAVDLYATEGGTGHLSDILGSLNLQIEEEP
jgi:hypothetical protein